MKDTFLEIIMQLRAAWRYRWLAMSATWLIAIVGWAVVITMPNTYESSARVYVDTDSILRPLLRGIAVQTDVGQRLRLMTRTLLSRPNLEKVARETDLDLTTKTAEEKEQLILGLTSNITLNSTRKQNLYTISYSHKSAKIAKDVVQALLTIFVETTLGDTRQDSDSAQKFLSQQIAEYETRLVEAENRLTAYKRKYLGSLPGQGGGIFVQLDKNKTAYQQAQLELREASYKRNELKRQLVAAREGQIKGTVAPASPYDARILELEKSLDQLLLRFTGEHPDVKEIRATIDQLKKRKSEEVQSVKGGAVVQSELINQLQLSLGIAEAELAGVRVRASEYQKRMEVLKEKSKTLPQIETELKRLSRDYSVNKTNYDALLARRESARMSESADAAGDSVKFKIIDPPRLPVIPSAPNRPALSIIVLVLSLAAGGLIAFLMSQLHPVLMDVKGLGRISGYPVFGSVSRIWTPSLLFKRKLEVGAFFLVVVGLVVLFVGVLILNNYAADIQIINNFREGL